MIRELTTIPTRTTTLDGVDTAVERISVVELTDVDGAVTLELRFEATIEGLGWFVQRRLSFDGGAVRQLQGALSLFVGDTRTDAQPGVVGLEGFRNQKRVS